MEISFRKATLEDKELLNSYLKKMRYRGCEKAFACYYLWSAFYPAAFDIIEDTLVFFQNREDGKWACSFPIGDEEKIPAALEAIFTYCREHDKAIQFYMVQQWEFELLEKWYPGRFEIEYNPDIADYVYEADKLITLAGKKYHGKRNHINNFIKNYPDWSYEKITEENVQECIEMAKIWQDMHICTHGDGVKHEMCVTMNSLKYMKELDLVGGLIRAEGKIVAFSLGEELTTNTFVVHIEKAFPDIQGAYPMINQQFAIHEAKDYTYINREDDTGEEGLRKAKLSYRPAFMVEKGWVKEKQEEV